MKCTHHLEQDAFPELDWKVPGAHGRQSDVPPCPNEPGLQVEHSLAPVKPVLPPLVPAGQGVHPVPVSENVPAYKHSRTFSGGLGPSTALCSHAMLASTVQQGRQAVTRSHLVGTVGTLSSRHRHRSRTFHCRKTHTVGSCSWVLRWRRCHPNCK